MNRVLRRLTTLITTILISCLGLGFLSGQSASALAPRHEGAARCTGTTESKHARFSVDDSANNVDSARVEVERYLEPLCYDAAHLLRVSRTSVATKPGVGAPKPVVKASARGAAHTTRITATIQAQT